MRRKVFAWVAGSDSRHLLICMVGYEKDVEHIR